MKNLALSFEEVSGLITNAAIVAKSSFPFVTVPNFKVIGYHARVVTGVAMFLYAPIINSRNVAKWNSYSANNTDWIQEGRDYLRSLPERDHVVLGIGDETVTDITPIIWRTDALGNPVASLPPPHVPIWQVCD